jgi:hypothetical protein
MEIKYPYEIYEKILRVESSPQKPYSAYLSVPSITEPGKPFTLKAGVLDKDSFPVFDYEGTVKIIPDYSGGKSIEITFKKGSLASAAVEGISFPQEGSYRLYTEFEGQIYFSNPTSCRKNPEYLIYWGDPHIHTSIGNCMTDFTRSLNYAFVYARFTAHLDWVSVTDHVSNGRGDIGRWKEERASCEAFNQKGEFITLPGYEASLKGGGGGDNNVYFKKELDIFIDDYEQGNIKTLAEKLNDKLGKENFFVVPHHTTRIKKHGEIPDEIFPGDDIMPLIEIHSKWGSSEYRGNPYPLQKVHPGPSYAVDFLNRGLKLAFVGGTDSHASMTLTGDLEPSHIDRPYGITGIFAGYLTRDAVFDALKTKKCYASAGEKIFVDFKVNGTGFYRKNEFPLAVKDRKLQVQALSKNNISTIEIIRNGKVLHTEQADNWNVSLDYVDTENVKGISLPSKFIGDFVYYYARVRDKEGNTAWSSPVWFNQ